MPDVPRAAANNKASAKPVVAVASEIARQVLTQRRMRFLSTFPEHWLQCDRCQTLHGFYYLDHIKKEAMPYA